VDEKFVGIPKTSDAASRRYIYYQGDIIELPRGMALAKKWGPLPKSLLSLLAREAFVKPLEFDDMSVHDYFHRRFNCKEVRLVLRFFHSNYTIPQCIVFYAYCIFSYLMRLGDMTTSILTITSKTTRNF